MGQNLILGFVALWNVLNDTRRVIKFIWLCCFAHLLLLITGHSSIMAWNQRLMYIGNGVWGTLMVIALMLFMFTQGGWLLDAAVAARMFGAEVGRVVTRIFAAFFVIESTITIAFLCVPFYVNWALFWVLIPFVTLYLLLRFLIEERINWRKYVPPVVASIALAFAAIYHEWLFHEPPRADNPSTWLFAALVFGIFAALTSPRFLFAALAVFFMVVGFWMKLGLTNRVADRIEARHDVVKEYETGILARSKRSLAKRKEDTFKRLDVLLKLRDEGKITDTEFDTLARGQIQRLHVDVAIEQNQEQMIANGVGCYGGQTSQGPEGHKVYLGRFNNCGTEVKYLVYRFYEPATFKVELLDKDMNPMPGLPKIEPGKRAQITQNGDIVTTTGALYVYSSTKDFHYVRLTQIQKDPTEDQKK